MSGLADDTYWVVVDSRTIAPNAGLNSLFSQADVWAEQTYGSAGAVTYNGGYSYAGSAGASFGGMQSEVSDNASALTTAEHVTRAIVSGADVTGLDSGFSFNVVVNTTDAAPTDPFTTTAAWSTFDAGDNAIVLRYDTWLGAGDTSAWNNGSGMHGEVLRYDTQGTFNDINSWSEFNPDANGVGTAPRGYWGAVLDGQNVMFVPIRNGSGAEHGEVLILDTQHSMAGQGSRRQFIQNSNGIVGTQSSQFAIPTTDSGYDGTGNGEYTIQVAAGGLPDVTDTVVLDGTTQSGFVDRNSAPKIPI